jgi:hypothetical protein
MAIIMGEHSIVVVSYSPADIRWKTRILTQLSLLELEGLLKPWCADYIGAGADRQREIDYAVDRATAAILLVSADFLGSRSLRDEVVSRVLTRHRLGRLCVFPILVKPCDVSAVEWLKGMTMLPSSGRALSLLGSPRSEEELAKIALKIRQAISPSALESTQV